MNNTIARINNKDKITPLWAFNESILGGVLHIIKIPFKGILISNIAVILITLLAYRFESKSKILKSTFSVLLVKWTISPHSPITAYVAVALQGLFGNLFYFKGKISFIKIISFSSFIAILTGFQKIIILTIIFGETLWKSLDELMNSALKFFFLNSTNTQFSLYIIIGYVIIHLTAGIATAFYIKYLLNSSSKLTEKETSLLKKKNASTENLIKNKKPKKISLSLLIIITAIVFLFYSYFLTNGEEESLSSILIMLVRGISIILLWFMIVVPLIRKLMLYIFSKEKSRLNSINELIAQLPEIKNLTFSIWNFVKDERGIKKYFRFFNLLILSTTIDNNEEEVKN